MGDTGIEHRNWEWLTANQKARENEDQEKKAKGKDGKAKKKWRVKGNRGRKQCFTIACLYSEIIFACRLMIPPLRRFDVYCNAEIVSTLRSLSSLLTATTSCMYRT